MFSIQWWEFGIWSIATWFAVFSLVKLMKVRREYLVGEMRKQIDTERVRLAAIQKKKKQQEVQKKRREAKLASKNSSSIAA